METVWVIKKITTDANGEENEGLCSVAFTTSESAMKGAESRAIFQVKANKKHLQLDSHVVFRNGSWCVVDDDGTTIKFLVVGLHLNE